MFINSWHANDVESAAMWSVYVRAGAGIAVRSTFERLCGSIPAEEKRPVFVGAVTYVDYESATIPEGNIYWPFVH